jgi:N-acetyl-gamma-glutamyl-phosphate reductase
MMRVSIAGASGYAGGELLRLLLGHPDFEIAAVAAGGKAGQPLSDVHPQLRSLSGRVFDPTTPAVLADADLVFLALPHGESAALAAQLPQDIKVVDLGADFRLGDAAQWEMYYGSSTHAGTWTYGLPELPGAREAIAASTRVANPGCYATSITLALAPLAVAGLIEMQDIVVVAASGTSGAGRKPTDAMLATQVMGSMSAYKVGGVHQHTPEIEQSLARATGQAVTLSFTPLLAPMPRGIVSTSTARVMPGVTEADLRACLNAAYADESFVHVMADGAWPQTSSVYGSNAALVQVALDAHVGRAIIVSAIDNLGKGAAGQALQNANLMCGFNEATGLTSDGDAP